MLSKVNILQGVRRRSFRLFSAMIMLLVGSANLYLIIRFTHPAMMTRYGWGAVRAQA